MSHAITELPIIAQLSLQSLGPQNLNNVLNHEENNI